MPHVVFVRGANVGGRNVFRPAQLAREMAHLDVVNVGAAGTFVVRGGASALEIRQEIQKRLPFELTLCVRPAREIVDLVRGDPFKGVRFSKTVRGWVGVLSRRATAQPKLPVIVSARNQNRWVLRIEHVDGAFVRGRWRLLPGGFVIPANEVERVLGVPATVRWWETFERIASAIGDRR